MIYLGNCFKTQLATFPRIPLHNKILQSNPTATEADQSPSIETNNNRKTEVTPTSKKLNSVSE